MTFDEKMVEGAQQAVLNLLRKGDWLKIEYNDKVRIDLDTLKEVYNAVDMNRVKMLLKEQCEEHIATIMFNAMASEITTDTKQILSNKELREDIRSIIREKMKTSVGTVTK